MKSEAAKLAGFLSLAIVFAVAFWVGSAVVSTIETTPKPTVKWIP